MKKLDPSIIEYLAARLSRKSSTVKKDIYNLVRDYPSLTKNAVAQMYARKNGVTVFRKLDKGDKATLPSAEIVKEKIIVKGKSHSNKKVIKKWLNYETDDYFKKGHVDELNRAYSGGCYTSVFILTRKIIENLMIDILKAKFPENTKENKELYFDVNQKRFKDFDIILSNIRSKKHDFGSEHKAVERLYQLAKGLKDDANDKTHSWYHLVKISKELDQIDIQTIVALILNLEKCVGLR